MSTSSSNSGTPAVSLGAQLRGFDRVFWICIFMELMERMAYYGVRLVVPVYLVLGQSAGGPGLDHVDKGLILAAWGAMQSWLPTFAGGFSDRFGYKRTIFVAVLLKTAGYIGMAMATDFWTMFLGTQLLAAGTGLFKPGIQGTLAHSIAKSPGTDSMGWGLFYQSVNVGAAVSAYIPAFTRDVYGWSSVFIACSAIVCSNLIPLFFYEDPKDERAGAADNRGLGQLIGESFKELFTSPQLLGFILISAGFWFSFHQCFDMLPNYVDDWTDSTGFKRQVGQALGWDSWVKEADAGINIPQERLLNLNSILIMTTMFVFAWLSSKVRVLTSTIGGMLIASLAVGVYMVTASFWPVLFGITMFSVGEMLSSPKRQEYMASLAPPGKRALYLGYANMPDGIGWVLGNLMAGEAYEVHGDKINLARKFLAEQNGPGVEAAAKTFAQKALTLHQQVGGLAPEAAKAKFKELGLAPEAYTEVLTKAAKVLQLPADTTPEATLTALQTAVAAGGDKADLIAQILPRADVLQYVVQAVPTLPDGTATTAATLRDHLYATYQPGQVWTTFIVAGLASTVLMVGYDRWVRARAATAG
jgi:dipeptide/tripeptide permease